MAVVSMDTLIDNIDKNFPPSIDTYSKRKDTLKRRINLIFNQIMSGFEGERRIELITHLLEKITTIPNENEPYLSENEVDLILGNIVSYLEEIGIAIGGKRRKTIGKRSQ